MYQRRWLLCGSLAWLAFVVAGSLVPFKYQGIPFSEALQQFIAMYAEEEVSFSRRSDWGANMLLGIPLGFLWLGTFTYGKSRNATITWMAGVLPFLVGVSCLIEFSQLWFPLRTPSFNDVYAQAAGALAGATAWLAVGNSFIRLWAHFFTSPLRNDRLTALLMLYAIGFVAYSLAPLDLTISPVEIYRKASNGRIAITPFSHDYGSLARFAWAMVTNVALGVPIGVLAALLSRQAKRRITRALLVCMAFYTLIEAMQLLVISRYSDTTDILTGVTGGLIGALLAGRAISPLLTSDSDDFDGRWEYWFLAGGFYVLLLLAIYWWPFDFQYDKAFVTQRLANLDYSIGKSLYWSNELGMLANVLTKLLTFGVLGATLGLGVRDVARSRRLFWSLCGVGFLTCVAIGVLLELVQVLLPMHTPCAFDILLYAIGSLLGFFVIAFISNAREGIVI